MIEWISVNTSKINRVGYDIQQKSLYIDFQGSDVDTPYLNVPSSLFESFSESKDRDKFFQLYVEGVYEIGKISTENKMDQTWKALDLN